ncbi:unnamed protein product [Mytilus edulis]|uniref:Uncharacterized protein n=1 Tax=Mytilus edulis TaxID=6550 RepID=A0A8S3QCC1_MYTED|nr:unnamed protein product [Mytilus edulis]
MRDGNTTTRRQLPQPPIQTNDNQELEVSAHTNVLQTPGKEGGKENERPPPAMKSKQPSKSKRRYQDSNVSRDSGDGSVQLRGDKTNTNHSCTFRTLVRSLDEIRTRKSYKKDDLITDRPKTEKDDKRPVRVRRDIYTSLLLYTESKMGISTQVYFCTLWLKVESTQSTLWLKIGDIYSSLLLYIVAESKIGDINQHLLCTP